MDQNFDFDDTRASYALSCSLGVIDQILSRSIPLPDYYQTIIPGSVHEEKHASGNCCSLAMKITENLN